MDEWTKEQLISEIRYLRRDNHLLRVGGFPSELERQRAYCAQLENMIGEIGRLQRIITPPSIRVELTDTQMAEWMATLNG